jgi:hypothetical protein
MHENTGFGNKNDYSKKKLASPTYKKLSVGVNFQVRSSHFRHGL